MIISPTSGGWRSEVPEPGGSGLGEGPLSGLQMVIFSSHSYMAEDRDRVDRDRVGVVTSLFLHRH